MIKNLLSLLLLAVFVMPASADIKSELRGLVREKATLEREIGVVFAKHGLRASPEYKALIGASIAAATAFTAARKAEPKLKGHYDASDRAQKKMIDATVKGDKEQAKAAQSELIQARMDLERDSQDLPGLKAVREKAVEANNLAEAKKQELLATVPEGKALLVRIEALDLKIAEMRRKR